MVRLFRIYRFCALVKREIYAQNTADGGVVRTFLLEFDEDPNYISKEDLIGIYKPRFTRKDRLIIAEEICHASITNQYLLEQHKNSEKITINAAHNGGVDLTSGLGFGFVKELLRINNHFVTLLIATLALVISVAVYLTKS